MSIIKTYYFERPKNPPRMIIQDRDVTILNLLDEYRVLDSYLIYKLIKFYYPDSYPDRIKRRLQKLWANGYIDRPKEQVVLFLRDGQYHLCYSLTEEGADLLATKLGKDIGQLRERLKEDVGFKFLQHLMQISRVRTTMTLTGLKIPFWRGDGQTAWKIRFKVESEEEERLLRKGIGKEVSLKVTPDSFFCIEKEEAQPLFFALEIDRGQRTLTDMATKFLGYSKLLEALEAKPIEFEGYKLDGFKVLTFAPVELRIKHLKEEARRVAGPRKIMSFLFSTLDKIDPECPSSILGRIFKTADGKEVSLLDT